MVDLQGPRGSRGRSSVYQGVKEWATTYKVQGGQQGVGFQGPRGSRGRLEVPGGQRVGLQGLRGSRGRPTGFLGVKGWAC